MRVALESEGWYLLMGGSIAQAQVPLTPCYHCSGLETRLLGAAEGAHIAALQLDHRRYRGGTVSARRQNLAAE
jgi:hypothetical protein